MQRRSIIACRPGASSGVTSLAPIAASAELVREEQLPDEQRPDDDDHDAAPAPAANSTPTNTT